MTCEARLLSLDEYIKRAGVRHFSAREICPVGKRAGGNGARLKLAPRELWVNILPTLKIADDLRDWVGGPVMITSGYRDDRYNLEVGGAKDSLHKCFNALDVRAGKRTPLEVYSWLTRHPRAHEMGLGYYDGFVHMDTRGLLGRESPVRW